MPKAVNRPSQEQAKEFDAYVKHWQTVLNLGDWRMERGRKAASKGAMADVSCDSGARLAVYQLGDWAGEEINPESLRKTALHECLHVFLFDLIAVAQDRLATSDQLEVAEHRVINVLERVLAGEADARSDRVR